MDNKKYIAVTIQNYVQFYSIKLVIDKLIENGNIIDIYVPIARDDWGLKEMFDEVYDYLNNKGYSVRRTPLKRKYKVLLEPYPMEYYFSFNYEYRLKYCYGIASPKPSLTYRPDDNFVYDAILIHSTYEQSILRVYSKTYLVGKSNFYNFKKRNNKGEKPTVLYMPTYGDSNTIEDISEKLYKLKDKYRVITKLHHGTNYFNYEENKRNKLLSLFDECYDSKANLEELLSMADIVLTDNSGAIFDALYTRTPLAIFAKNLEYFKYDDLEPYQCGLVKTGIIPYTNKIKELDKILIAAQSKDIIKKQKEISDKLFPLSYDDGFNEFMKVINLYLSDEINKDELKLHRILLKRYFELKTNSAIYESKALKLEEENKELEKKLYNCNLEKFELSELVEDYKRGKLYKIAKKIYSIIGKIIGR